jgi:hypothetical protein
MRQPWSWWRSNSAKRGPLKRGEPRFSTRHKHLVYCMMDAYIAWREECLALEDAYRRWASGDGLDAELAWATYMAGLDREERASILYGDLVRRVNETVPEELRPETALAASTPPA